MFKQFRKIFRYFGTWFGMKAEAAMDPEVQIQQALEEGTKQHFKLKQAAAEVITNQKMIEKRMANRVTQVAQAKKQAQAALLAAEQCKTTDPEKSAKYTQAANTLAMEWKSTEQLLAQDKEQYAQAEVQAKQAQDAIYANELKLQEERARAQKLRSISKQAKMQKALNDANQVMQEAGTLEASPTLDSVESKLQEQLSREEAKADIHSASAGGIMDELRATSLQTEANDALDELRKEMGLETAAPAEAPAETATATTEVAGESANADA